MWAVPARHGGGLRAADGDEAGFAAGKGGLRAKGQGRYAVPPWRINVDGSRALLDVVIVGVGYLL